MPIQKQRRVRKPVNLPNAPWVYSVFSIWSTYHDFLLANVLIIDYSWNWNYFSRIKGKFFGSSRLSLCACLKGCQWFSSRSLAKLVRQWERRVVWTRLDKPILNLRSFFKSVKQHSHLFNLNLCCLLDASTRPDASLFLISSQFHILCNFLTTFWHLNACCSSGQVATMSNKHACNKASIKCLKVWKSCTKIAEVALVLAVLQQTASKKKRVILQRTVFS